MDVKVIDQKHTENWTMWNADCIDVVSGLPDESVGLTVFSPPFASLYTFSDNPRDVSNNNDDAVFWEHFSYLIGQLYRVMKPGRIVAVHVMQLPTSKTRDGFIGVKDFRGDTIRAFQNEGFIFHSEVMIRKCPVTAMQRTKAIGLLHKQVCKDSTLSRMALSDYIIAMRKPGENTEPVSGPFDRYYGGECEPDGPLIQLNQEGYKEYLKPGDPWFSVAVWQRVAESVWTDIDQTDVLTHRCARDEEDERHISPLQLTPIRRVIDLWSNPGDIVFSPFAGIGSELYCAVQMGRKAIGAELKESYYKQAVTNLESLEPSQTSLLDMLG